MKKFTERFEEMLDFTGLTAYKLAKELDTSDVLISNYRMGKTKPSFDFLSKLAKKYELLNIHYLLTGEGKLAFKNDDKGGPKSNIHVATTSKHTKEGGQTMPFASPTASPSASPTTKKDYKSASIVNAFLNENAPNYGAKTPTIITITEQGIDNIIYVPIKAAAGYLLGYGDTEFIESLPSFRMPGLSNNSYRMFEVDGLSMSPTLSDKDRVICEWVPNFEGIRENRVHVVVHKEGIAVKRVLNRVKDRNKIYLKSDTLTHRQDFPIKEVDPADIVEIWYVRLKVSGDLSEPSEVYTRLADLELNQYEIMKKLGLKDK